MIELGCSEEIVLEMDRLANEDHSHVATEEEIEYRGNWWIRSNLVNSDTMPTRHRPDFKKALSTLYRLKKSVDNAHYENTVPLHGGNGTQLGRIPIMRLHHKDGVNTYRTGKLVQSVN